MRRPSLKKHDSGPYDRLYAASQPSLLWGDKPGRLVLRAAEWLSHGARVLDAGCGDGKNAFHLEEEGYLVEGIDSSTIALRMLQRRFQLAGKRPTGNYPRLQVEQFAKKNAFEGLVSYGLFHCLTPLARLEIHHNLQASLRHNGIVIFSTLMDTYPLPHDHKTSNVWLASTGEVDQLFDHEKWTIVERFAGPIFEDHEPLVGHHRHDALWIVARKIR